MKSSLFSSRNLSIDILRGLTMLLMVFVNDLWSVGGVPHFLEHFDRLEDGMGVADIVFPMFLFAMGMSIPYAIERRFSKGFSGESTLGHIISRTLVLVLLGAYTVNTEGDFCTTVGMGENMYQIIMVVAFFLVWNNYRDGMKAKPWLQAIGIAILIFLAFVYRTPSGGFFAARWWGILGLIGWAYCFCAVTYLLARNKPFRFCVVWAVLCVANMLMTRMRSGELLIPVQSFFTDFARALQIGNASFTIMAAGGMAFSVAESRFFSLKGSFRVGVGLALAAVLAVAAAVSHHWWIISKLVGTLPWCLYVSAISVALYTVLRIMEAHGKTAWFNPFKASGTATLSVYMMPYVLYSILGLFNVYTFEISGIPGLLKCLAFSFVCVGLTSVLVRFGVKLKI